MNAPRAVDFSRVPPRPQDSIISRGRRIRHGSWSVAMSIAIPKAARIIVIIRNKYIRSRTPPSWALAALTCVVSIPIRGDSDVAGSGGREHEAAKGDGPGDARRGRCCGWDRMYGGRNVVANCTRKRLEHCWFAVKYLVSLRLRFKSKCGLRVCWMGAVAITR
jgi:hypothetical protein